MAVLEIQKELNPAFTAPELETRAYVDEKLGRIETLLTEDREARNKERDEERTSRQKTELEQRWLMKRSLLRTPPNER